MAEFQEGDTVSFGKTITDADVVLYSGVSGDTNPVHLNEEYAAGTRFGRRIAHGMLTASLVSAAIGTKLPGPGAIYMGQTLRFLKPVFLGDTITANVTLERYDRERGHMTLRTTCVNQDGQEVLAGEAEVLYRP